MHRYMQILYLIYITLYINVNWKLKTKFFQVLRLFSTYTYIYKNLSQLISDISPVRRVQKKFKSNLLKRFLIC